MSSRSRKCLAVMLFALSILVFTGGNLQAAQIRMTTRLGFGDYIIPGHWVPLWVQITGAVESARVEVIRYNDGETNPTRESFTLSNTGAAGNGIEIPVMADFKLKRLITRLYRGEQLITEQLLNLSNKTFPGHFILTINLPATEQQAIEKSLLPLEPVLTVPIQPEELPGLGLNFDGVSGLVINDPGLVLAPAQIKTLRGWLAGGGRMVVFTAEGQPANWIRRLVDAGNSNPKMNSEVFPVGFGRLTVIHQDRESLGLLRISGEWRKAFDLKPYSQTFRLTPGLCFPEQDTAKSDLKLSPINPLSVFLICWSGAGVFLSFMRKKGPKVFHFLVLTLLSIAVTIPLAGKMASNWKHGAAWHTRAVILPAGGGTFLSTTISLIPSGKWDKGVFGSQWGVAIKGSSDESGGIKLRNNGGGKRWTTLWRHQQMGSRYSLSSGGATNLVLAGCFPELGVNISGISISTSDTMNLKLHQIMIPNETISWDGKQWRLLLNNKMNAPLWQEMNQPPEWFRNDAEWMKHCQSLFPDTLWLGGRYRLPDGLCIKIQGGPIPEFFWVMPQLK
ncbi:MAG TPA: hypothetical protein VHY08_01575 [Bacillota bacterium]|nr:hypothetical protein [Bacillota bacterium]